MNIVDLIRFTCEKYWLLAERDLPSALKSSPSCRNHERKKYTMNHENLRKLDLWVLNTHVTVDINVIVVLAHCCTVFFVIFHLEGRNAFVFDKFSRVLITKMFLRCRFMRFTECRWRCSLS